MHSRVQVPIRWPKSRDEIWQANVPDTFLADTKADQHWMVVNEEKVNFPGGGTHFPNGADKYIANLAKVSIRIIYFPSSFEKRNRMTQSLNKNSVLSFCDIQ